MNNYRAISVLPIFARILEKVVHDQMIEHFGEKQRLKRNQHLLHKLNCQFFSKK